LNLALNDTLLSPAKGSHSLKTCKNVESYIQVGNVYMVYIQLNHDMVDRYGISVSQMTTDMFHLS
jgi:hypothetical protein